MRDDRQKALARIAGALLDADLARLRAQRARCDAAAGEVSALDAAVARQHQVISAELEAPVAGPVLDRWGSWADRRRIGLTAAVAREAAELEQRRQAALTAFGRAEALRLIAEKAEAEARRKARRRGR